MVEMNGNQKKRSHNFLFTVRKASMYQSVDPSCRSMVLYANGHVTTLPVPILSSKTGNLHFNHRRQTANHGCGRSLQRSNSIFVVASCLSLTWQLSKRVRLPTSETLNHGTQPTMLQISSSRPPLTTLALLTDRTLPVDPYLATVCGKSVEQYQ